MERRGLCIGQGANKRVIEEEICCFQPAAGDSPPVTTDIPGLVVLPSPKEPWSIKDHYTLFVDGTKLIRTTSFGNITLFDTTKDEWKASMISSPGMPKEGICRIVSKKREAYRGEDRLIVIVSFTASLQGEVVYEDTWTLASGIGVIALGDFKLTSIEKVEGVPQGCGQ